MEALIACSLCGTIPASGTWNYQRVGGVVTPVCHDCIKPSYVQQLDTLDEILAEANKDLNNESLNHEAAQPTTPSHDGESKATNE